jgi:hypothetical protein
MNKLKTLLCAVFTLMLVNISTTVHSDSSNFAGPYVGITGAGYGMQLSGASSTDINADGDMTTDEVSLGQVAPVTGFEAGYAIPIGSAFLIDIGAAYYSGEAKLDYYDDGVDGETTDTALASKNVSLTIKNLMTGYIAPTIVLSDTSSLYIKVGLSEAKVTTTGGVTAAADLSGTTWAMGTRTVLNSGIFIRTEAGYTDYNGISATGKGTSISTRNSYSANPTIAFGAVSLGFRF